MLPLPVTRDAVSQPVRFARSNSVRTLPPVYSSDQRDYARGYGHALGRTHTYSETPLTTISMSATVLLDTLCRIIDNASIIRALCWFNVIGV